MPTHPILYDEMNITWSSSVEGGTTLPLRFPFQLKARSFYYQWNYKATKKNI